MFKQARVGLAVAAMAIVALSWSHTTLPNEADGEDEESYSAGQVLATVLYAYQRCETYSDTGVERTVFHTDRGERVVVKPFATAFVRPDRFRYEFVNRVTAFGKESRHHYIIWQSGDEVRTHWDVRPGLHDERSLSEALSAAAGVSGGTSFTVPRMLLPEQFTRFRDRWVESPERLSDEHLGEIDCFRLKVQGNSSPETLWIAKSTFLIHRIDQRTEFDDFHTESTTTYVPVAGAALTADELGFDISPLPY